MYKQFIESILNEFSNVDLEDMMYEDSSYRVVDRFEAEGFYLVPVEYFGGEDQGSDYYCIWKFTKSASDTYVKFYGWYASHYGSEYQGWCFVEPKIKTIVVYE